MESWVYLFSKFTHEALLIEALIICIAFAAYAVFYITQKRKYGVAGNELPSNVVKAYLAQLMIDAEDMRTQLFGLLGRDTNSAALRTLGDHAQPGAAHPSVAMPPLPAGSPESAQQLKDLEAKMNEQAKALDSLLGEKKRLEEELNQAKKASPAATAVTPAGTAGAADPALAEKVKTLEAQLAEYAIIEDDLANLKRLQKENKTLRTQLDSVGAKPADSAAPESTSETPASAANSQPETTLPKTEAAAQPETTIAPAEPAVAATERELVDERAVEKQNQSIVAAPPQAENAPTPELAANMNSAAGVQTPSKNDETNFESLINDVEKSLAQTAAPGETLPNEPKTEAQAKSEAELQADFEKMLNS